MCIFAAVNRDWTATQKRSDALNNADFPSKETFGMTRGDSDATRNPLRAGTGASQGSWQKRRSARKAHLGTKLAARAILWFGFYLFLVLSPLLIAWLRHPPEVEGRPFSLQFSAACGYVAFSVMAFEFALIARLALVSSAFGQDVLLQFHRQMAMIAALLVALHVVLVFKNGYPLTWLYPVTDGIVQWGTLAVYAVILLIVLSLARKKLRIPYGWWQTTHSLLASSIIVLVVVHVLKIGSFVGPLPMKELWGLYLLLLVGLMLWFRLFKPLLAWQKPWTVVENIKERGGAQTLVIKPVGHTGLTFEPGQFAWLNTGKTPFHRDQHPISISSCAFDETGREVGFTIKALGDWSSETIPAIEPGRKIWLDGPYGVFSPDREQGPGYILIAGGVGVTPFVSMCATFAARGDMRPVVLFYGGSTFESLTLREQLESLRDKMNLRIVYVLTDPDQEWTGESGFITTDVLERHLPEQFWRMQYFVCGPVSMMDAMEQILPEIGVPSEFIHTERFSMI